MSLEARKKELEEQIEIAVKREDAELQEELKELEAPAEEPKAEEEKPAEPEAPVEPEKPAEQPKVEEPPPEKTKAEYVKERKDRAALRARVEELEARLAEATKPKAETVADPEPDPTDELEHVKWENRQLKSTVKDVADWKEDIETKTQRQQIQLGAEQEFMRFEDELVAREPEYAQARSHFIMTQANAIRLENPNITQEQLVAAVKNKALMVAARYVNAGYENPAEAMYESIKAQGWKPQPKTETKEEPKELKPDLDKVAANRARNAGTVGGSGRGAGGQLTRLAASGLTNQEWAKLSPEEKARLLNGG